MKCAYLPWPCLLPGWVPPLCRLAFGAEIRIRRKFAWILLHPSEKAQKKEKILLFYPRAVQSKRMSERCKQMSQQTGKWPSTYVPSLCCTEPKYGCTVKCGSPGGNIARGIAPSSVCFSGWSLRHSLTNCICKTKKNINASDKNTTYLKSGVCSKG